MSSSEGLEILKNWQRIEATVQLSSFFPVLVRVVDIDEISITLQRIDTGEQRAESIRSLAVQKLSSVLAVQIGIPDYGQNQRQIILYQFLDNAPIA
jgi:hypothetical protein